MRSVRLIATSITIAREQEHASAILLPVRAGAAAALFLGLAASAPLPTAPRTAWAAPSEAPLSRLADRLAAEVLRQARGRAVELLPSADATGRGARLPLDLDELVRPRVQAGGPLSSDGPRLQVAAVVSEAPGRLIVSARLVEQPGARLQDVVVVSIDTDPALLALAARPPAAAAGTVDVLGISESPPVDGRVLDLAFVGADRLLALGEDELTVFRWEGGTLIAAARRRMPGPLEPVRHPGGLLRAVEREAAAWVATSRLKGAILFGLDEGALAPRQRAEAMPWPGAPSGVRFRAGTDLIDGAVEGLGPGPFLHLDESGVAVDREGRLLAGGAPPGGALRVGPALAPLWPRVMAACGGAVPGERDVVLVVALRGALPPRVLAELPVTGAVRALAAHTSGRTARVVAAVEMPSPASAALPRTHLWVFDLSAPGVDAP
jgi:hypothetical protein